MLASLETKETEKLRILHQSKHFIVIDKPFDVIINSDEPDRVSVHSLLKDQFPDLTNDNLKTGFYVAHRLDYSTSGVLVIPLTKSAAQKATKSFETRKVKKYYLAILRGHCDQNEYQVNLSIGEDSRPELSKIKVATSDSEFCVKPRSAETKIHVLNRGTYQDDPVTKVIMEPLTGRRHQLRIHCYSLGHTILGDYTYSDRSDTKPKRMYLHAYKIDLPNTLEDLVICAGDPFEEIEDYKTTEEVQTLSDFIQNR